MKVISCRYCAIINILCKVAFFNQTPINRNNSHWISQERCPPITLEMGRDPIKPSCLKTNIPLASDHWQGTARLECWLTHPCPETRKAGWFPFWECIWGALFSQKLIHQVAAIFPSTKQTMNAARQRKPRMF